MLDRRHWVFDMDGTLTEAVHDFDGIRRLLGLPVGVPILEALDAMTPQDSAPLRRRLDDLELDLASAARPQPGAPRFVRHLAARGCRLGILTRNSRRNALVTLQAIGLADVFDPADCLGRDECRPKPSPQGILELVRRWGARPDDTVMIGDYLFDVQAGRAAGTATVLFGPAEASWLPFVDHRIDDFDQLVKLP